EPGEGALAGDGGDDLLVAAEVVLRHADDLSLPAMKLAIAAVHAEEVGGEQRGLVAARAGAHLQDDALLVGRILGEQVQSQLLLQFLYARRKGGKFIPGERREVLVSPGIGYQRREFHLLGLRLAQSLNGSDDRVEVGELLRQLRERRLIAALT